jgi:hypothetical protein
MKWVCAQLDLKFEGVLTGKITLILQNKIGNVFKAKS